MMDQLEPHYTYQLFYGSDAERQEQALWLTITLFLVPDHRKLTPGRKF